MFSVIYTGYLRNGGLRSQLNPAVYLQVLSGSGVYDGSEIHEASSILIHLTREGAVPQCYAPDVLQMHVIDHKKVFHYSLVYHHSLWFGKKIQRK
jgi:hypothetical protein